MDEAIPGTVVRTPIGCGRFKGMRDHMVLVWMPSFHATMEFFPSSIRIIYHPKRRGFRHAI